MERSNSSCKKTFRRILTHCFLNPEHKCPPAYYWYPVCTKQIGAPPCRYMTGRAAAQLLLTSKCTDTTHRLQRFTNVPITSKISKLAIFAPAPPSTSPAEMDRNHKHVVFFVFFPHLQPFQKRPGRLSFGSADIDRPPALSDPGRPASDSGLTAGCKAGDSFTQAAPA